MTSQTNAFYNHPARRSLLYVTRSLFNDFLRPLLNELEMLTNRNYQTTISDIKI